MRHAPMFLQELALLEWTIVEAIHAPCCDPLPGESMSAIPTDQ